MAIKPTGLGLRLTPTFTDVEPAGSVASRPKPAQVVSVDQFTDASRPRSALSLGGRDERGEQVLGELVRALAPSTRLSAMLVEPAFLAALAADILEGQLVGHRAGHGPAPFDTSLVDAGSSLSRLGSAERAQILVEHPSLALALEEHGVTFTRPPVAVRPGDLDHLYATQGMYAGRARSVAEQVASSSVDAVLNAWKQDSTTQAWANDQPEPDLRRWGQAILIANAAMKRLLSGQSA